MRKIRGNTLELSGKLFVKDLSLYFPKQERVGDEESLHAAIVLLVGFMGGLQTGRYCN